MTGEDWKVGYQAAVAKFMEDHGQFVDQQSGYYGWADDLHTVSEGWGDKCRVVSVDASAIREDTVHQFAGTFASQDFAEVHVEVKATCACGKYKDAPFHWGGSLGDILQLLLAS